MLRDSSRAMRAVGTLALLLLLTSCFQPAGSSLEPTTVDLTAIAPTSTPTAEAFFTPLPPDYKPPTDTPTPPALDPTATPTVQMFEPTATDVPPTEAPTLPPTDVPTDPPPAPAAATEVTEPPLILATLDITLTPTLFLPPTPTGLPTDEPCVHTVQPNEWANKIARQYGISLQDLLAANPQLAGNPDALQIGQVLRIPGCVRPVGEQPQQPPVAPADATQVTEPILPSPTENAAAQATPIQLSDRIYTVVQGDTLGSIARKFGITVQMLKDANGLTNDFIRVNQQLKIPLPGN